MLNTGIFPFTTNNNIEVYIDGNQKFEKLIKDIKNAKEYIHLEYFIIKESKIGTKIKNALFYEIKVELTPKQEKVFKEVHDFWNQEITGQKVKDFLFY